MSRDGWDATTSCKRSLYARGPAANRAALLSLIQPPQTGHIIASRLLHNQHADPAEQSPTRELIVTHLSPDVHDLIVIGAGPIGLEAALYAADSDLDFVVLEKDEPGATLQAWGRLLMFSPMGMNTTPLGRQVTGWSDPDALLTGREMKRQYFDKIASLDSIAPRLISNFTVQRIGRRNVLKGSLIGDPRRAEQPFLVMGTNQTGRESIYRARSVIDASGVYANPNRLGPGGLPALGEHALADRISYHLDILPGDPPVSQAKRYVVVGSGHSACTVLAHIDRLTESDEAVEALWVTANADTPPVADLDDDPLPERKRMVRAANALAEGSNPRIHHVGGRWVEAIEGDPDRTMTVTLTNDTGGREQYPADHIYAMVGYRPDRTMYEELQVHECYASSGPMKLSAALLSSGASSDCMAEMDVADDLFNNPEPDFYILGAKSYGRTTNFLIRKGHDQIRTVFKQITGDPSLDRYV
ncbi:hypothetical protein GF420_11915 [candidate division GN15 bacterium]|nr:hypothetical protein [candidate division GN15 bacterium]